MIDKPNWVAVRTRVNPEKGKLDKFLIDCNTGKFAESDNPATWTDFETACEFAKENGGVTLAYALDGKDGICCIDVDKCFTADGKMSPLATSLMQKAGKTYIEKSLSGNGLHIFGTTKGMDIRTFSKDGDLEYYQKAQFIALTGDCDAIAEPQSFDNTEVETLLRSKCEQRTEWKGQGKGLDGLQTMSDRDVVEKAIASKHGDTFSALYEGQDLQNNRSNSDMSLMNRLAFWCNGDKEQMLRIFATSGLYRPNKSPDYYEGTAIKAIRGNNGRFQPQAQQANVPLTPLPTGNGKR
jgi:primase-polymerase (primpol)-like protein